VGELVHQAKINTLIHFLFLFFKFLPPALPPSLPPLQTKLAKPVILALISPYFPHLPYLPPSLPRSLPPSSRANAFYQSNTAFVIAFRVFDSASSTPP